MYPYIIDNDHTKYTIRVPVFNFRASDYFHTILKFDIHSDAINIPLISLPWFRKYKS